VAGSILPSLTRSAATLQDKKDKKKKEKKEKKAKAKKKGSSSSSSNESDDHEEPGREEVQALDQQLRDLGVPVRKFGETHLDRLKRWNCEKQRRAGAAGGEVGAGSSVNPKREGWMTMAARDEEGGAAKGAADGAGAEEAGESAKAAALMGSLDSLLMGTSSVSAKQQKRESDKAGDIQRNEDQPAFLKKMADAQAAGTVPGAPGLWVPPGLSP